ncbi:MAG TPA: kynureninase [Casimicrobiaceae bacterium]|nr:kynureninase [Casimicrobiaceae bacterium]
MATPLDADFALELDRADALARFREEFVIGDADAIYLDGNSLGRLPRRCVDRMRDVVERQWGGRLIRAWADDWFDAPRRIGAKIARLLGATADEVIVADSTSVNLFKLVIAALKARPGRSRVVTDDLNFPSDLYVLRGALELAGDRALKVVRSEDGVNAPLAAMADEIDERTALVTLSHTAFKSGYVHDLAAMTALAHRSGALMLWDLSHSVGAMPLALDEAGVDLAVGCTYKYLNGGPGAPAFLYVRRGLQESLPNPVRGWFGQRGPFDFALEYDPAPGIARFLTGTPPTLSLAAIEPAVDLLLEAGLDRLRQKSVRQTEYLIGLWEALLRPRGFSLNSPRDPVRRGSHVSFGHRDGWRIDQALIGDMRVLPDFRHPDNIRFGVAPVYTSFAEIHEAVTRLVRVMDERRYEKYPMGRAAVT